MNKLYIWCILVFAIFAVFRGAVEIQAGILPVGWDSINYYAPWTIAYVRHGILNQYFLGAPPFVFVWTIVLYLLTNNIWLSIKVLAPILYGVLGLSIFYFARSYLSWTVKKSMMCSALLMFQLGVMRISWDLFKNELAIAILFFQLPLINFASRQREKKLAFLMVGLSVLIVLSHQLVAAAYFMILLTLLVTKGKAKTFRGYLIAVNIPALILFLIITGIYAGWILPPISTGINSFSTVIHYFDFPKFSIFENYMLYNSYSALFAETLTLLFLLYALILPLVLFGFWHDQFLTPFLVFLAIASFLPLASPSFAILYSERWMWMLAYIFPFYATNGISRLMRSSLELSNNNLNFKKFSRFVQYIYRKKLAIAYTSLLALFAVTYAFGMLRPLYEPFQGHVPGQLSQSIISPTDMQEINTNIGWLNDQYHNHFTLEFLDHFDSLTSNWSYEDEGNFTVANSIITLDSKNSEICSFSKSFGFDYFGTIEIKFRFNRFSGGAHSLELLTIRRSNGCGGGVVYLDEALTYWDPDRMLSYRLVPLDDKWHILKVTFNETCKLINIDGLDKLHVGEGDFFGKISLGQVSNSQGRGGSLSIDYISVHGNLRPVLVTFFRELGPVWVNLDERFEIITCVSAFSKALDYAGDSPYTQIFMLLPTDYYRSKFALVHEMPHYSIFNVSTCTQEDLVYFEIPRDKPQSGGSWFSVSDALSWSGIVMKASDSSLNGDRLFGPYVTSSWDGESMLGKPHIVTFRLKVTSNLSTSDVVCIDVAYDAGSVLKSMRIKASDFTSSNSWQDFQLTFTVPSSLIYGLEFRVQNLNNGITDLFVDYIQVKKAWNTTTKYAEAAMNKPQSGGSWFSVSDALSWSGIVMKASDSSLNGDRLFGPYVTSSWDGESMLGKPYIVTFRLKVTSNLSTSDVVCIDVAYDAGSVLKSMRIKASDFISSNSWQDFQLTFTVPSSLIYGLEFRVQNLNNGITDLFVDQITVTAVATEH